MKCFKVIYEDGSLEYVQAKDKAGVPKYSSCELCKKSKAIRIEEMSEKELDDVFGVQPKKKS